MECGARMTPATDSPRAESPDAYTPAHLASKIRSARERLTGERKQVTVLFADLKGSLELLADRDPEDARALLDTVLERMMEAVHRYEGTVNQVMGDGIMRSEEHTSELQSRLHLVCRLLLEKKKKRYYSRA